MGGGPDFRVSKACVSGAHLDTWFDGDGERGLESLSGSGAGAEQNAGGEQRGDPPQSAISMSHVMNRRCQFFHESYSAARPGSGYGIPRTQWSSHSAVRVRSSAMA